MAFGLIPPPAPPHTHTSCLYTVILHTWRLELTPTHTEPSSYYNRPYIMIQSTIVYFSQHVLYLYTSFLSDMDYFNSRANLECGS